jgi:hypothetical protein
MPHIPRTLAPSTLINPDSVPRAPLRTAATKPPTPYTSGTRTKTTSKSAKQPKLVGKLNMQKWDVDPLKVFQQLTGKELAVDEYSRLVSSAG